jgi:hypothetical protein
VAIFAVITLSVTALYVALCYINLPLAKSSAQGMIFGDTLRVANALRGLMLEVPAASLGVALGGYAMNLLTGTVMWWGMFINPVVQLAAGLASYRVTHAWGRSFLKDTVILAVLGLVGGVVIALNLSAAASVVHGTMLGQLLTMAAFTKITSNVVVTVIGGTLVLRTYDAFKRAASRKG